MALINSGYICIIRHLVAVGRFKLEATHTHSIVVLVLDGPGVQLFCERTMQLKLQKKLTFEIWNLKRPMEKISACTVQIWPGPIIASGCVHPQYNPDHGPVRTSVSTPSPPGNPRPLSPRQRSPFPPPPLSVSPASAQSST